MKLSVEWLQDFLNLDEWPATTLADKMSRTGIEIEGVENFAEGISDLVIGRVVSVVDHPNSDHLHICEVYVGEGDLLQIVCGADNVVAGAKVITALPGAILPGGIKIKKGKLRGEVSEGMLCSLQELGFSDSVVPKQYADGLFLLPKDAPVGDSVVDYLKLNDAVLELSITPNRADALSMRGAAHEVGAITHQQPEFALTENVYLDSSSDVTESVQVSVEDKALAPKYQLRLIRNVRIGESPLWLQMRLMKAGIRPINNIVDITNYFLLLYGQPMHAFDYDTLSHKNVSVQVASEGMKFTTLDGVERVLSSEDVLIMDGETPIALAGVMGGLDSEVTETTRNILLETAVFDPIRVRTTSKKFNLRSESSARFEKGINLATIHEAGEQAAIWMAQLGGGHVAAGVAEVDTLEVCEPSITVRYDRIPQKLGITLSPQEVAEIFQRLGFECALEAESFTVKVPARRWDITIEADILEEIARIYGYDRLPATLPTVPSTPGQLNAKQRLVRQTRTICESFGLNQTISYVLTSPKQAELLRSPNHPLVHLDFPMSEERSVLRQSMFPALLEIARYNQARNNKQLAFYETGKVFYGQGANVQPLEEERLALFLSGQKTSATWYSKALPYDFFDLKGMVEGYFEAVRLTSQVSYRAVNTVAEFHPGRTAEILLNGEVIGLLGQIHPKLAREYDLEEATFFAEMNLDAILAATRPALVQQAIPKYPSTSRDLALLVEDSVAHHTLADTIQAHGGNNLVSVELFDLFVNAALFPGKKSLAYRLTFQNPDRTLTDEDVLSAMNKVTQALQQIEGLEIR
ncbi:MAG: phenylalanine--tRNA ligase subunit beta [Aerococcaceae bacterium]|nr:phenylalanine--tRNA ligase subunit beta [Aerococcaceae bacterium]